MATTPVVIPIQNTISVVPRSLVMLKWLLYMLGGAMGLLAAYGVWTTINLAASDATLNVTLMFVAPQLSNLLAHLLQRFLIPAGLIVTMLFAVSSLLLFIAGNMITYIGKLAARLAVLETQERG